MKHLVQEAPALYGPPHYEHYTFLLSLSDAIPHGGFEHHQSSDDRAAEEYLTQPALLRAGPDLMSHEYSHSWNGKYRRPAGMRIDNYNEPMKDDLIWVYEGMNEYLGKLLAVRSGLATPEDMRSAFAMVAAEQSYRTGRDWRPLADTAISAPFLYEPGQLEQPTPVRRRLLRRRLAALARRRHPHSVVDERCEDARRLPARFR